MITPKKSINSRRGGGSTDTSIAWWKILFLVSLILLVSFLVHLNYQLVTELGRPASGKDAKPADDAMSSTPIENRHGQRAGGVGEDRLKDLRRQVSTMKEKIGNMRGMVEEIKQKNADVLPPHRDSIISDKGEFERLTCTPEVARKQADRMNKRFNEWWSHSACPDQVWMENIHNTFDVAMGDRSDLRSKPYLILDIGCNKGYTSADFFDALSPGTNINPHSLVDAIRAIARDMNTKFDRDGGVCNDSNKPLNVDRDTERRSEVHCFEPSPATYNMLTTARSKLMPRGVNPPGGKAMWHMHNKGLHEVNGQMSWHSACASAVGDELCTIVPDGTSGAISVPVVTVDAFLKETYPEEESLLPLVHMLKIDAEGLDPAVLTGSTSLLSQNRAIMVMFEFNPGLSEKGDNRHGMWGKGGNPRKKLLEVTTWLDQLGYDCYLDTKLVDEHERAKAGAKGVPDAPALYRITGDCLTEEPQVRGWANVVCASRQFSTVASMLRNFATMV